MKIKKLFNTNDELIEGPLLIEPEIFHDERGYFFESWNQKKFNYALNKNIYFVQDNNSFSKKGVLRGLHFQLNPFPQGKLIMVNSGEIFDVIVDLRKRSKTFSSWTSVVLNSSQKKSLWIPEGFAHGFLTLSENASICYKVTNFWHKDLEHSLLWDDEEISINWPININDDFNFIISQKDQEAMTLNELIVSGNLFI
tara:strand:- start:146 stop:736 length:591 start_codon:yes stop_codon:yes gene_type:complete